MPQLPWILASDSKMAQPLPLLRRGLFSQKGRFAFWHKNFKEAVKSFEESLALVPEQGTYLALAKCLLEMKGRTQEAVVALGKCIDMNPETEIAVAAGMELAGLGRLVEMAKRSQGG